MLPQGLGGRTGVGRGSGAHATVHTHRRVAAADSRCRKCTAQGRFLACWRACFSDCAWVRLAADPRVDLASCQWWRCLPGPQAKMRRYVRRRSNKGGWLHSVCGARGHGCAPCAMSQVAVAARAWGSRGKRDRWCLGRLHRRRPLLTGGMAFRATARLYKAAAGAATSAGGHAPYGGFVPHVPAPNSVYVRVATGVQALMWFWVFHRAKEDGAVVLVRAPRTALLHNCAAVGHWRPPGARARPQGLPRARRGQRVAWAGVECEPGRRPRGPRMAQWRAMRRHRAYHARCMYACVCVRETVPGDPVLTLYHPAAYSHARWAPASLARSSLPARPAPALAPRPCCFCTHVQLCLARG